MGIDVKATSDRTVVRFRLGKEKRNSESRERGFDAFRWTLQRWHRRCHQLPFRLFKVVQPFLSLSSAMRNSYVELYRH